jgi:hypothetical protein
VGSGFFQLLGLTSFWLQILKGNVFFTPVWYSLLVNLKLEPYQTLPLRCLSSFVAWLPAAVREGAARLDSTALSGSGRSRGAGRDRGHHLRQRSAGKPAATPGARRCRLAREPPAAGHGAGAYRATLFRDKLGFFLSFFN